MRMLALAAVGLFVLAAPARARAQDEAKAAADVPEALRPFEHLVGAWKGAGVPTANRVRGWVERHNWAWAFDEGRPIALTWALDGNQMFASNRLLFDANNGRYRMEGQDPEGTPYTFTGTLDESGQVLTLEREQPLPGGIEQRLTLRLNSNLIRYVVWDDRKEPGAPRFGRVVEINQGKEGESFAAGGAGQDLPKCILTGGASTMTVSYQGKSYPVCCTGCRDEFNENPEKYVAKAEKMAAGAPATEPPADAPPDAPKAEPKRKAEPEAKAPAPPADKAARALARAREQEKAGQRAAAVAFYKIVAQNHPDSPEAKVATERLKALGEK